MALWVCVQECEGREGLQIFHFSVLLFLQHHISNDGRADQRSANNADSGLQFHEYLFAAYPRIKANRTAVFSAPYRPHHQSAQSTSLPEKKVQKGERA